MGGDDAREPPEAARTRSSLAPPTAPRPSGMYGGGKSAPELAPRPELDSAPIPNFPPNQAPNPDNPRNTTTPQPQPPTPNRPPQPQLSTPPS